MQYEPYDTTIPVNSGNIMIKTKVYTCTYTHAI